MVKSLVTGLGVVSDLGGNYQDHVNNLFSLYNGIKLNSFKNHEEKINLYVGKVVSKIDVPDEFKNMYNNLVYALSSAIQAVNMSEVNLKDKRIAVTFGTSLGGKVEGEEDLYKYESGNYDESYSRAKHKCLQNIVDEILKYFGVNASTFIISTACSASNNAVILGSQLIKSNNYDVVLAGGSDELADVSLAGFTSLGAINRNESDKPYQNGSGISLGEGSGFIVLEPSNKVSNKKVYAEILDGMVSSDAYHITSPDPRGEGAEYVIDEALSKANLSKDDIDYVNGHGTGTKANDSMEYKLLSNKFNHNTIISSTKGQTGHTLGAAGIIEVINTIAMIDNDKVVGSINDNNYQTDSNGKSIFLKNEVIDKKIDFAINLSFAFGGNNSCSVIARPGVYDGEIKSYEGISSYSIDSYDSSLLSNDNKLISPMESSEYELIKDPASKMSGYYYNNMKLTEHLNRREYKRLDDFSKMVIKSVARTFKKSNVNYKKIDSHKIGIVFATPVGAVRTVEGIESSIPKVGYEGVSASHFPYTVLNAAAGIISENFKIKGPVSVITAEGTGFSDSFEYADEFAKNYELDYLLMVNANQISKYELFGLNELGFDNSLHNTDFVSSFLMSKDNFDNNPKILCENQIKGSFVKKEKLKNYIDNFLSKNKFSKKDIKEVIINSNFKTNSSNQLSKKDFEDFFNVNDMGNLGFSTQGAGEELVYLLSNIEENGNYLIVSESPFGGYSFLLVRK